jgi:hypothetical protein
VRIAEEASPDLAIDAPVSPASRPRARWRATALGALILVMAVLRVWIIRHCPEPDGDAKGHIGIAAAVLADPLNVAVHWVWPPGYHFFLAGLLAAGLTAQGVRLLDCALAAVLPVLVWSYGERTMDPSADRSSRHAPFLAAVLCAVMPVVNLMGTSAQQESLFTILVLLIVWSIDRGRFAIAGAMLAVAVMIRYEAFGAVGLLVGLRVVGTLPAIARRLPAPLARACRLPLVVVVPPIAAGLLWLVAHRVHDGTWFGFLRELYRYTRVQRESFHQDRWTDLFWFPVRQPYYLFGLTLPLFFLGLRRAWRVGLVVPLGIWLFLVASYTMKGTLGSARYYESLTPFVCVAAAHGACAIGERRRSAMPLAFAAALAHVVWLLAVEGRWTFHV